MGFWIDPATGSGVYVADTDPLPWDPTKNGAGEPYVPPTGGTGGTGGTGAQVAQVEEVEEMEEVEEVEQVEEVEGLVWLSLEVLLVHLHNHILLIHQVLVHILNHHIVHILNHHIVQVLIHHIALDLDLLVQVLVHLHLAPTYVIK